MYISLKEILLFADRVVFTGAGGLERGVGLPDIDHGTKCDLIAGMQLHCQYVGDLKTNLLMAGGLGR